MKNQFTDMSNNTVVTVRKEGSALAIGVLATKLVQQMFRTLLLQWGGACTQDGGWEIETIPDWLTTPRSAPPSSFCAIR